MSTQVAEVAKDEKPLFDEHVQALINEGRITVTDDEVKVGAEVSPNGEELKGSYKKLKGDLPAALDYLGGDAAQAAAYIWDKINTVRKNSARQTLVNQAVPTEDKAMLSAARKLVKAGLAKTDAEALAKIKESFGSAA